MPNPTEREYLKKLVNARLRAMPPDITFSVGSYGEFSRDDLIDEVENFTEIGKSMIEMQVTFIQEMPRLLSRLKK